MYKLYVCNSAGAKVAYIKDLVPFNGNTVLKFSDYISSYGQLTFRVQTKDPLASTGIFSPYQNHVKVYRNNVVVWCGIIANCPQRNRRFIEVEARTYAYLMSKVAVAHTADKDYREFTSGNISTAITTIFNEGKNRGNSPIADFTLGTVTNPKYPWDSGVDFVFTTDIASRFQASSLLQVIMNMADVSNSDFTVSKDKVFTFMPEIGETKPNVVFKYGKGGNVDDYNSPLDGTNMSNDLYCASLDKEGLRIIDKEIEDTSLYQTYYRLWSSILFGEYLTQNLLNERAKKILSLNKLPDTQLDLMLNDKAAPFGTYDLGDYITVMIEDGAINVNKERRIIGWDVAVSDSGVESVTVSTNDRI